MITRNFFFVLLFVNLVVLCQERQNTNMTADPNSQSSCSCGTLTCKDPSPFDLGASRYTQKKQDIEVRTLPDGLVKWHRRNDHGAKDAATFSLGPSRYTNKIQKIEVRTLHKDVLNWHATHQGTILCHARLAFNKTNPRKTRHK